MTRSGGRKGAGDAIAELFATSAHDAVLRVLRDSGRALAKAEILDRLAAGGVPRPTADQAWGQAQKRLRQDHRVIAIKDRQIVRYRWNPDVPSPPSATDALTLLVEGRLTRGERHALAQIVRAALAAATAAATPAAASAPTTASAPTAATPAAATAAAAPATAAPVAEKPAAAPPVSGASPTAAAAGPEESTSEDLIPVGQLRQAELAAARELVGMAIDVEEQVAKGASAKAIIHRVRARMKRLRLEPVERAGETVAFDRTQHQPMRSGVADGAPVLVVRPGYTWRLPGDDLVLEKPVVQD